jgi:hypothetical protein
MKSISLSVLLLALLVSCGSQGQTELFNGERFSFRYPKGWTIEDKKSFVDVTAPEDHPEEKGRERLTVSSETTDGMTLEQCYKKYVSDWYYDQYQGTIIADGNATINSRESKWMEYQYGEKASMTTLVYLVYCGDRFFLISTLSSSKQYPNYKEKFKGMIDSFTVSR